MITYDSKNKIYCDIRRNVTGRGATSDEAKKNADEAEKELQLRASKARIQRWTTISKVQKG